MNCVKKYKPIIRIYPNFSYQQVNIPVPFVSIKPYPSPYGFELKRLVSVFRVFSNPRFRSSTNISWPNTISKELSLINNRVFLIRNAFSFIYQWSRSTLLGCAESCIPFKLVKNRWQNHIDAVFAYIAAICGPIFSIKVGL